MDPLHRLSTEEVVDRLAFGLSQEVPQGNIDRANGMDANTWKRIA